MSILRTMRTGTGLILLWVFLLLAATQLSGCSENDSSPTNVQQETPPVLPDARQLVFDFSFFEAANELDKAAFHHENFLNAYLRTVILQAMAHLVLAPPVSAFSAAIHTVPQAQPDGSWIWTYPWQGPDGTVDIVLRGLPAGDVVQWNLSLIPQDTEIKYPWFSGTTNGQGDEGHWAFRDLDTEGYPVTGEISWGSGQDGDYLEFMSLEPGDEGNTLRFTDNDPHFRIDFVPGDGSLPSFIRWHADGSGSLQVPDYNGGLEACWDIDLVNSLCQ